jgi:hypothetical protein
LVIADAAATADAGSVGQIIAAAVVASSSSLSVLLVGVDAGFELSAIIDWPIAF